MNYLILIGPPAVGKSTLANKLKDSLLNSKIFSFDKEFPLEIISQNEEGKNSKDYRKEFIERIRTQSNDDFAFDWIIIEDTCHLKSMQKRYIQLELENEIKSKVIFLYISARNDQISELKRRNSNRAGSPVKCEEIENITNSMNTSDFITTNFIKFNFENVPETEELIVKIKEALDNYKFRCTEPSTSTSKDTPSDSNHFNQLNLALNKEISRSFKESDGKAKGNGTEISKQKKLFLLKEREKQRQSKNQSSIEELIEEFRIKYLH